MIDMIVATLTSALSTLPKGLSPLNWLNDFPIFRKSCYVLFFFWLICSGPGRVQVSIPGSSASYRGDRLKRIDAGLLEAPGDVRIACEFDWSEIGSGEVGIGLLNFPQT